MTEVVEPQYTYVRCPDSRRVITLCYRVTEDQVNPGYVAIVGASMNRPTEQFSKKVGRKIAKGRMESTNAMLVIPLETVRKIDRREEIFQFIASETELYVEPLISKVMKEYLWYRDVLEEIEKSLWAFDDEAVPPNVLCSMGIPGGK